MSCHGMILLWLNLEHLYEVSDTRGSGTSTPSTLLPARVWISFLLYSLHFFLKREERRYIYRFDDSRPPAAYLSCRSFTPALKNYFRPPVLLLSALLCCSLLYSLAAFLSSITSPPPQLLSYPVSCLLTVYLSPLAPLPFFRISQRRKSLLRLGFVYDANTFLSFGFWGLAYIPTSLQFF